MLIVVSGPVGSGKTTLAHELAWNLGCPAICRDEIKEGMVFARNGYQPAPGDALNEHTFTTFADVLKVLVHAGVTVVAEAAFQGPAWRRLLEGLRPEAEVRVIQYQVDPAIADARRTERDSASPVRQAAHTAPNPALMATWQGITLDLPLLQVDTTGGYDPGLDAIIAFCKPTSG